MLKIANPYFFVLKLRIIKNISNGVNVKFIQADYLNVFFITFVLKKRVFGVLFSVKIRIITELLYVKLFIMRLKVGYFLFSVVCFCGFVF